MSTQEPLKHVSVEVKWALVNQYPQKGISL